MDKFRELGYEDVEEDVVDYLSSNKYLIPKMMMYMGLGWSKVLVETTGTGDKLYKTVVIGGSNGYDVIENKRLYDLITFDDTFYTLDELYKIEKILLG